MPSDSRRVSLKACESCMQAKYCNAKCQRKHRSTKFHVDGRPATRRGTVQGPTSQGGMSHLLRTDAIEIDMPSLASTRHYLRPYQFSISRMNTKSLQIMRRNSIFHAAGRVLAEDACTPIVFLEII